MGVVALGVALDEGELGEYWEGGALGGGALGGVVALGGEH